jgi:hypothetical protein
MIYYKTQGIVLDIGDATGLCWLYRNFSDNLYQMIMTILIIYSSYVLVSIFNALSDRWQFCT